MSKNESKGVKKNENKSTYIWWQNILVLCEKMTWKFLNNWIELSKYIELPESVCPSK